MASEVQIANWAAVKVGADRMLSLADDKPFARTINAIYSMVRDAELQRCRWRFAIKRTQLSADADAPSWGYGTQYTLPSDYLALVQVGQYYVRPLTKSQGPWTVEGKKLLTDLGAPLRLVYVSRVEDTGQFHPLFVDCLSSRLAAEAIVATKDNQTKLQAMRDGYKESLMEAARVDALEVPPDELPLGTWLESREGTFGQVQAGDYPYGSGYLVL